MGAARVSVTFRSEAARIDLNAAPKGLLAGLIIGLGGAPANAADYADRIAGLAGADAKRARTIPKPRPIARPELPTRRAMRRFRRPRNYGWCAGFRRRSSSGCFRS